TLIFTSVSFLLRKLIFTPPNVGCMINDLNTCITGGVNGFIFTSTGSDFFPPRETEYNFTSYVFVSGKPSIVRLLLYKDDFFLTFKLSLRVYCAITYNTLSFWGTE